MAWSGKVLGGLLGGVVGGPLGAGVGAAIGHYLADGEGAERSRDLVVLRLAWRQHAFGPSGPGVLVTPRWRARGHRGRDVRVSITTGDWKEEAHVEPEEEDEVIALPEVVVPYTRLDGTVRVRLESRRARSETAEFEIERPSRVRRLGSSGPARLVMALVGAARAGGREMEREDVRFIRESFTAAHPLDEDGLAWLRAWLRELRDADPERLTPEKVAKRLRKHVGPEGVDDVLLWGMRGARGAWPGAAAEAWLARLGDALGVDAARIAGLWAELDGAGGMTERARAREVLGVGPDADVAEVQAAWRRLVQRWHPDRVQGDAAVAEATRRLAEINAAWRVLRE